MLEASDPPDVGEDPPALAESSDDAQSGLSSLDDPIERIVDSVEQNGADPSTLPNSIPSRPSSAASKQQPQQNSTEDHMRTPYITESQASDPGPPLPKAHPSRAGAYSQDELESALQTQLRGAGLPASAMIASVVDYAREKGCELLLAEDYDAAAEVDTAIDVMLSSIACKRAVSVREEHLAALKHRLSAATQRSQQITAAWNQQVADFKCEANEALGRMTARHEEEQREFQAEWSRPEALVPFSKQSPTLLHLRKMQKSLALAHDYAGAKLMKEECDQLAREESTAGGQRATEAMRSAFLQLKERQQREIECFVDHGRQHIANLQAQRDAELRGNKNLQRQLRAKIAAGGRNAKVLVPRVGQMAKSSSLPMSGKALRQLQMYKTETGPARLDVRLDSMDALIRLVHSESEERPRLL
jgi:hypothetical protein